MNWLVVLSAIAALISAGAAMVAVRQTGRTFERGAELQALLAFTERYERIMSELPASARLSDDWPADADENLIIRLKYLNMCSEEFYLWESGFLSNAVWDIWVDAMVDTLASAPYASSWRQLSRQFDSYPEFKAFVEQSIPNDSLTTARASRSH